MFKKCSILLAAAALLAGCSFHPQLRGVAINHNELLAETEDQLMLLNIVRAKQRYPMHFTSITAMRGGATLTAGGELGFGLPTDGGEAVFDALGKATSSKSTIGVTTVSPKISGSVSTNPTFDMAVLNTDKFQRGIQQPVKTEFLEYLLQQGWKDDLVMALFIERIDLVAAETTDAYAKGDIITSFVNANNDPDNRDKEAEAKALRWRCFVFNYAMSPARTQRQVKNLADREALIGNSGIKDVATLDGKAFDIGRANQDKDWPQATDQSQYPSGIAVQRVTPEKTALAFTSRTWIAANPDLLSEECRIAPGAEPGTNKLLEMTLRPQLITGNRPAIELDSQTGQLMIGTKSYKVELKPITRSTEGVLYFLGEYSRSKAADRYCLPSGRHIFWIEEGGGPAAIAAHFRNIRHFIPETFRHDTPEANCKFGPAPERSTADRRVESASSSLQVLDVVQQLLNMQKYSDELPSTQSVTIVR